jgi:hypothetical protein
MNTFSQFDEFIGRSQITLKSLVLSGILQYDSRRTLGYIIHEKINYLDIFDCPGFDIIIYNLILNRKCKSKLVCTNKLEICFYITLNKFECIDNIKYKCLWVTKYKMNLYIP